MIFSKDTFFQGAKITTPFGWDDKTFPKYPRIHHAIDKAGPGIVKVPFAGGRASFLIDSQGNSVLRIINDGIELRLFHFRKEEINQGFPWNRPLSCGQPIGPAGDVGLGTGRHVHYQLMFDPGIHDEELAAIGGAEWNKNKILDFTKRYGAPFTAEVKSRGIYWMNESALCRLDPHTGSPRIIVDSMAYFGF